MYYCTDIYGMNIESDICIIGGGLSGLSSAFYMRNKCEKYNIVILEGTKSTGGRLCPAPYINYGPFKNISCDLGGEWISKDQIHIDWLIQALKVPIITDSDIDSILLADSKYTPLTECQTVYCNKFEHKPAFKVPTDSNLAQNVSNIKKDNSFSIDPFKDVLYSSEKLDILKGPTHFIDQWAWRLYMKKVKRKLAKIERIMLLPNSAHELKRYLSKYEFHSIQSYISSLGWPYTRIVSGPLRKYMELIHTLLFGSPGDEIPFSFYLIYQLPSYNIVEESNDFSIKTQVFCCRCPCIPKNSTKNGIYNMLINYNCHNRNAKTCNNENAAVQEINSPSSVYRIKGGAHTLCQKIIENLSKTKSFSDIELPLKNNDNINNSKINIFYNKKVVKIELNDNLKNDCEPNGVKVYCEDGTLLTCRKLIIAIPPISLAQINFCHRNSTINNNFNENNFNVKESLVDICDVIGSSLKNAFIPGRMLKFVLIYPRPFWRLLEFSHTGTVFNLSSPIKDLTNSGKIDNSVDNKAHDIDSNQLELDKKYSYFDSVNNCFRYQMQGSSYCVAPFDCCFDTSIISCHDRNFTVKSSVVLGVLSGFIGADNYDYWIQKPQEERIVAITSYLNAVWKTTEAKSFLNYFEKDWRMEPLCFGGPISVPCIGKTQNLINLQLFNSLNIEQNCNDKLNNNVTKNMIFFGGTETANYEKGTISGAIQSGIRCGALCLKSLEENLISDEEIIDILNAPIISQHY